MMYIFRISIIVLSVMLVSCGTTLKENAKTENSANQWVSIFNGENLNGWTMKINGYPLGENFANTFRVEDGLLSIKYDGYGEDFNSRFGGIYFNRKLSEYRLRVEYRFVGETAPGAPGWGYRDSGVQFHSQAPSSLKMDQPFPVCLEYNLHGGNGVEERPVGAICANGMLIEVARKMNDSYCTAPVVKKTFHGDQWVTLEIDIKDGIITHFVNGEEILTYKNPVFNSEHELGKTFVKNDDVSVVDGYISLQSNSHPIDFKRIELMEY
jgi:hypothetical protein